MLYFKLLNKLKRSHLFLNNLRLLFGVKLTFLFTLGIPLGILIGFIEIFLVFALQNFLVEFNLMTSIDMPSFSGYVPVSPSVLLLLVVFIKQLVHFISGTTQNIAYEAFNSRIRYLLAKKTIGSDEDNSLLSIAEVSNVLSNLINKSASFLSSLIQFVTLFMLMLIMLIGMILISAELALLAMFAIFLFVIPTLLLKNSFQKYAANVYSFTSKFNLNLLKNIKNIYFLRIVGMNKLELKNLVTLNKSILNQYLGYIVRINGNANWPAFAGVSLVVFLVVINVNSYFVSSALMIPFVYFVVRLSGAISIMVNALGQIQFNYPFLSQLLTYDSCFFKSTVSKKYDLRIQQRSLKKLVVKNLTIGRSLPLVNNINLDLNSGDFLLISGKSGKGKTTLLMTLIGIIPKLNGNILWNGVSIDVLDCISIRKYVSYSGSDPFLIDGSIEENLFYGSINKDNGMKNLKKCLDIACCYFINEMSGLQYKLKEGGEGISAGQKQRLSIARALLRNPAVLILDEATSNIDEKTEAKILSSIRKCYPDLIIIAVSHRNSLRRFASQVLEI